MQLHQIMVSCMYYMYVYQLPHILRLDWTVEIPHKYCTMYQVGMMYVN